MPNASWKGTTMSRLESYQKLSDSEVVRRLEEKLEMLIKEQDSVHFLGYKSDEIKLLEQIRGRPYVKCTHCNEDLALKRCEHHSKTKSEGRN